MKLFRWSRYRSVLLIACGCASGAGLTLLLHVPPLEGFIGAGLAVLIVGWQELRLQELQGGLEKANRAQDDFLANVSHEIRTPLHAVQATAELLSRTPLSGDQREMAGVIQTNCESLLTVVNELFDASRVEAGELRVEAVPFDVTAAVHAVAERMGGHARAKGLAFELSVQSGVPGRILGDPQRLRQVLTYLLDNAVKFTAQGKVQLVVSAVDQPAAALLFRIVDTGPGIDPDLSEKLLLPFAQADSTAARRHGGVGLGLTLANRLVALMGGSVGVDSRPGAGSTFWFLLPARVPPAEPQHKLRNGHILVVDDNPVNQMVAARAVHSLGYTTLVVSSGQATFEALAAEDFDLVLMDCQMPGMDGYQVTARIRREEAATRPGRHVPIVAMTANAAPGEQQKCLAAGMDDYLTKPIRLALLERTLERWISSTPSRTKHASPARVTLGTATPVRVGREQAE